MNMKKGIALILTLALALGVMAGCGGGEKTTKPTQLEQPTNGGNGSEDFSDITFLDGLLASGGKSEYAIVIAKNAGDYITFAASELQMRFEEATGVLLPILTDEEAQFSADAKYISIGRNKVQEAAGVTCDYSVFRESGARLVTRDKTVILTGAADEGALYAVYDLLKVLFDYEFYDVDAYTLTHRETVQLPSLDLQDIPDMDYRMYGDILQYDARGGSAEHAYRLRLRTYGQGYAMDGHAATFILSPAKYGYDHPDWFSTEGSGNDRQLCYTNEEMTQQFIKNVKTLLTQQPEATAISFGQADLNIWCHCATCNAAMEQYGNGQPNLGAITQILFVNKVVKEIDAWIAAEYPGRTMSYMILAYHQTEVPPAHKDASGNFVANAPELVLPSNVIVQYASIYTDRNIAFRDNPSEREKMMAWAACAPNLQTYEYPAHYTHVCMPYDGLHVFADNVRFATELGFSSYYMQGNFNTESSGFTPLKIYVASKLMWDSSLDPNQLAYDYIDHCYGEAAPYMRAYYDLLRSHMAFLRDKYSYGTSVFEAGVNVTNWPLSKIHEFQKQFDLAYEAIEPLKTRDPEQYEILFRKLMIEEMFLRYVNCSLYLNYYSDAEKVQMIDEFETYAIRYAFNCYSEVLPMSDVIASWRAQL